MRIMAVLVISVTLLSSAWADEEKARQAFFERKIRPVLVTHCEECHSARAALAGKLKGGLQLDHRQGLLAGGESGAAVVPGKPAEGTLLPALRHEGLEMPPAGKLPAPIIADFEKWIADGAFDPRDGTVVVRKRQIRFPESREFWSLRPILAHSSPPVRNPGWAANDVDRFILAKLEEVDLAPSNDATARVLVRRLYYDIIGLPPTPHQIAAFTDHFQREPDGAVSDLVDTLLASPHFGERWGRYWLDVVRYAESNGRDQNIVWHHAWRYRDYVIGAFNEDRPFDRFIREHVAGDLLPYETPGQRDVAITATGMLAMSPKNIDETNAALFRMDFIDDQIEVVTRAFLGLSVSCARCHDHKFDPIPTTDYYALAGIFGSSEPFYGPARWGTRGTPHRHYVAIGEDADSAGPVAMAHVKRLEQAHLDFNQARADRYREVRKAADLKTQLPVSGETQSLDAEIARLEMSIKNWDERIEQLRKDLQSLIENPPRQPTWVMALRDRSQAADCQVHIRGETSNPGPTVARGVLQLIEIPNLPPIEPSQSGRLQLAEWLSSPLNPLTPRVAVNRVWLHLFGRGLVSTVDDFGATGSKPSHPELLDHLAARFVEENWSVKSLVRRLVTSRTYRQASEFSPSRNEKDPDNVYLWRMSPRGLEVEAFRDAVLLVANQLDQSPPAQSFLSKFNPYQHHTWASHDAFIKPQDLEFAHRTVYLPVIRGVLPELFQLFDFADPDRVVGERGQSIVPAQSLFLLSSPWILQRSREAARDVLQIPELDDRARLAVLFERALGRLPQESEVQRLVTFLRAASGDGASGGEPLSQWAQVCQIIFSSAEFRTLY